MGTVFGSMSTFCLPNEIAATLVERLRNRHGGANQIDHRQLKLGSVFTFPPLTSNVLMTTDSGRQAAST
jgi:hypothetical protein